MCDRLCVVTREICAFSLIPILPLPFCLVALVAVVV